jgi:hypothetical protein
MCHGWEVCLARRGDNCAGLDHVHDDVGSQLLGVLGYATAVPAVGVYTCPDEEYEVH